MANIEEENPFLDMVELPKTTKPVAPKKEAKTVKVAPAAPAVKEGKKGRGRPKADPEAPDETKNYLYRTSPESFEVLRQFASLRKVSVNKVIDEALETYFNSNSNKSLFNEAKKRAEE